MAKEGSGSKNFHSGSWYGTLEYGWKVDSDGKCWVWADYLDWRTDRRLSLNSGWMGFLHFDNKYSSYYDSDEGTQFSYTVILKDEPTQRHYIDMYIPIGETGYESVTVSVQVSGNGSTLRGSASFRVGDGTVYGTKSNVFLNPHDHVKMGEALLIWMEGGEGLIQHDLYYTFGSLTTRTLIEANVVAGKSWTVPDLLKYTTTGGYLNVYCDTYSVDGRLLGTTSAKVMCYPPDATIPSIESNVTLGQETTIDLPRGIKSYALTLKYKLAGETVTLCDKKRVDNYAWTPALTLAKKFPADWTAEGVLVCETYNGSTLIGTIQKAFRFVLTDSNSIRPAIGSFTRAIDNSHLPDAVGKLIIQKRSYLKVTAGTILSNHSIPASVTFSLGSDYIIVVPERTSTAGSSKETYGAEATFTRISSSGSLKLTATVRDQRGKEFSKSIDVTVTAYEFPSIIPYPGLNAIVCERSDKDGVPMRDGEYLKMQVAKQCTDLQVNGVSKNKCTLKWRIRQTEGQWGSWRLMIGESGSSFNSRVPNVVSDPKAGYEIEMLCADTLGGTHTLTFLIKTDAISFVLYDGEDGAAFGKYPEGPHRVEVAEHMEFICYGQATFQGKVVFPGSEWKNMTLCNGIKGATGPGNHPTGGVRYRVENKNRVYVEIAVSFNVSAQKDKLPVAVIPEAIKPTEGGHSPSCLGLYGLYLGQFSMDFQSGYLYFNGLYPGLEPSSYPFGLAGVCGEISYFLD